MALNYCIISGFTGRGFIFLCARAPSYQVARRSGAFQVPENE